MSFLNELKRRNVFKVGAAYLALAWLVLQLTSIVVPAFELPAWTLKFVIWFGVVGFPCALVVAWVYELTPEGLKLDSEVDPGKSITHLTSRRLDYTIIALLVVSIGLFLLQYVRPPTVEAPTPATEAAAAPAQPASLQADPPAAPQPVQAIAPDDKSIAVLPFADMSQAKDQEYFSDGMSEELLNLLAQVHDLKVIARTSSFAFRGKDVPIAEIAKQLNVAHVLEGSVRKSGNTVRITAQLIRTADSVHLWSEAYDRPLDDIFKVQDEIANAIVQALQIKLAGGELSRRKGGTQNSEAYQLYLRANGAAKLNTRAAADSVKEYLEQAVKLDPNYGLAWSFLADNAGFMASSGWVPPTEGFERSRELVRHALQLSPDSASIHAQLQQIYQSYDWDWPDAEAESLRALALDPGDFGALNAAGGLYGILGRWGESERAFRAALVRDPLNSYVMWNLGVNFYGSGRFVEAEETYRKVIEMTPDFLWVRGYLAKALLAQGKAEAALAMVQQNPNPEERVAYLPVVLHAVGRSAEADAALQALIDQAGDRAAYAVARIYAYRGDRDLAMQWLERAYNQKDSALPEILGEFLFKNMANDPRFIAFLHEMNLPTEPVPVNWQ